MSDKNDKTPDADTKSERVEFDYAGVTWRVLPAAKRPWQYVPTWNRGEWDTAIKMLIPDQYEKFVKTVVSTEEMNGWFEAYSEAMGGNS